MRATDVVRMTLDLIDIIDKPEPKIEVQVATDEPEEEQRFASVFKMLQARGPGQYANSPNEVVADIEDVTTAIKGEPQDARVKDPRGNL
jgi:hypothetical protein|tara:strand:- start:47 stop:313 length:267 start_codon:yes stop_codon:yes gene_type:complete